MAISTGGIIEEWGEPKQCLIRLMRTVREFAPRKRDDEYVVDVAFRSWDPRKIPDFEGVQPAMVGRTQCPFIVWHSVPVGLVTDELMATWLTEALPGTARLCREHLPKKSRAYPAEALAQEVEALATHLRGSHSG